jgi:hypothetical protein
MLASRWREACFSSVKTEDHMLHRRSVIQTGLAALGAASVSAPSVLRAQNKALVKIRYNEVVRSVLYAPAYVAITNGYFKDAGLDVEMTTANGGDKSMAALISGGADIALMGPEAAIYVLNSDSSVKARVFCGLTATDGFMLVARTKVDKFDWSTLKGQGHPWFPSRQHAAAVFSRSHAHERCQSGHRRQTRQQRRHPGPGRLVAFGPKRIRHLHRARCIAA